MKPFWIATIALIACSADPHSAFAQSRDGVYRGTLVCGSLLRSRTRAAIELTMSGRDARFTRPVVMTEKGPVAGTETGTGTLDGDKLMLVGSWSGDKIGFESNYAGVFVRRASLKFTGMQTWTRDGKTTSRKCTGSAKRAPAFFRRRPG
jgi:hypothetical protein